MRPTKPTFLYDADCGACSRFKRIASFLDASRSVDFVPIDEAARLGFLDSIPSSQWYSSSRMLSPDGAARGGGDSLVALLAHFPGGRLPSRALSVLPFGPSSVRRFYGVVSRLHGDSCAQPSGRPSTLSAAWSSL